MVAAKSAKRHVLSAIDALSELFIESLLPPSRKLKTLQQQDWRLVHRLDERDSEEGGRKGGEKKGEESNKGESVGAANRVGSSDSGRLLLMWRFEEGLKEQ